MATMSVRTAPTQRIHGVSAPSRAPLRDAPSAVLNSPLRGASTAVVGSKRARHESTDLRDPSYENGPHAKKMAALFDETAQRRAAASQYPRRVEVARPVRSRPMQEQTAEAVKQWQKHYRKAFPAMVFYFESVSRDQMSRLSGQVRSLGAHEEAFFSKSVTHVVTMRQIPSLSQVQSAAQTINPLALQSNPRGPNALFGPTNARTSNDILVKAQQMEIKIWTVEKLQRILDALYHVDPAAQQSLQRHGHGRGTREAELSEMLRNERRQAAQDRDWMTEMVPFKGYYVYVHDMNERTKPIMVRDYPRVASKEQGKWPQFRVAPPGRSPFTEDHQVTKTSTAPAGRAAERPKALTRAATTTFASQRLNHGRALEELPNPPVVARKPGDAQPRSHIRNDSADFLPTFGTAQATLRGAARVPFQGFGRRLVQGEPVASGIQPSNITSAVRSQIVSSAAVGPGGKAGSTRELNVLNRKMIAGKNLAQKKPVVTEESKPAKRNLNCIAEEEDDQRRTRPRKKRAVEKETKSGYCENCHEKFDDFDEHVVSRNHRKFAQEADHFRDLDRLLGHLRRK